MRFLSADTLTGKIAGEIDPSEWNLGDPLRSVGVGSLTIPIPSNERAARLLEELIYPRRRWIALQDDEERFLWAGPVVRGRAESGGNLIVPVADWRTWFYRAPIRPLTATARRSYKATNVEETSIAVALLQLGLGHARAPKFVIDTATPTGVHRDFSAAMLDRRIGELLDTLRGRGGPEWWCYCSQVDADTLQMHVAVAAERRTRTSLQPVTYRIGRRGNAYDPSWPEGLDASTQTWAVGEGDLPVWSFDSWPEVDDGLEPLWETIIGPLDGVKTRAKAFEHAFKASEDSRGRDGLAELSMLHERVPLGNLGTGDRVHVLYESAATSTETDGRIIRSEMAGGQGRPTFRRITVDLSDTTSGEDAGEDVSEGE